MEVWVDDNKPTPYLVQPIGTHSGESMHLRSFCIRGKCGFLNCDAICMCVVNCKFELIQFVSDSVYVDLQYDEISLTFTDGSGCLCGIGVM